MPHDDAWRRDLARTGLNDAVEILLSDPIVDARMREVIAERLRGPGGQKKS
jgi:hypothetical protein